MSTAQSSTQETAHRYDVLLAEIKELQLSKLKLLQAASTEMQKLRLYIRYLSQIDQQKDISSEILKEIDTFNLENNNNHSHLNVDTNDSLSISTQIDDTQNIMDLEDEIQRLVDSKLELIKTTSLSMKEMRDTIKLLMNRIMLKIDPNYQPHSSVNKTIQNYIHSGDNYVQNEHKQPIITSHIGNNTQIERCKGHVKLEYATHSRDVKIWKRNTTYKQGDVVYIDISNLNKYEIWRMEDLCEGIALWSVCMKEHISNESNQPHADEIFSDLVIDITPHIQLLLLKYVQGFNTYLSDLVTSYTYKCNPFWWNGCMSKPDNIETFIHTSCGNLVMSLDGKYCKKCKLREYKQLKDDTKYNVGLWKGSMIAMNKDTGKLERKIVNENEDEEMKYDVISKTLFLNDDIKDKFKRQKIFNLLIRNFNPSMTELIRCCMNGKTVWHYGMFNQWTVSLGHVTLWALYADYNQDELLCALLWRSVLKNVGILMFEILFLATSEHVRYQHYGQEMVKRIMTFAMSNCYDIVSVAAVPRHGVGFWSNNGFEMKYEANGNKPIYHHNWGRYDKKNFVTFMKSDMLRFQDTPLFAKFLT